MSKLKEFINDLPEDLIDLAIALAACDFMRWVIVLMFKATVWLGEHVRVVVV